MVQVMAMDWAGVRQPGGPVRVMRWLTILGLAIGAGVVALGAFITLQARGDAWRQAQQSSDNLALALERDIGGNFEICDLSLQDAADTLKQPGIDQVSPALRRAALFGHSAATPSLGAMLVLDASGSVIADSIEDRPKRLDLGDRDYFTAHRDRPDVGLYVSQPFRSRLRDGKPTIAISRRLSTPDGGFGGTVVWAVDVAYFDKLFEKLDVGPAGAVALFRTDGRLIARLPYAASDFGLDMSGSETFRRVAAVQSGHYVGISAVDGVNRLYTFRRIGELPLVVSVAVAVSEIDAAWRTRAVITGCMLGMLCLAIGVLCVYFRREMLRRLAAEGALTERAEALAVMAATDGLTGLGNRRAFEAEFNRAWRHGVRIEGMLTLLMLDADCFKSYNDRYGHQAGDDVLRRIAGCIKDNTHRPFDFAARYGGEEFVILLPDTSLEGGARVAEAIRDAVEKLDVAHDGSPSGVVTISIGVATSQPLDHDKEWHLVEQADEALYDSKRRGRNRVTTAGKGQPALGWSAAMKPETLPLV